VVSAHEFKDTRAGPHSLEKRTFTGRDGLIVEIPAWQVRIQHLCRSAYFNLKTANAAEAAVKAREIYVFLIANGWEATLEKFKPQPVKRTNLTVDEFTELYRKEVEFLEYPPGPRTIKTEYFTPKGKRRRVIPVEEVLWEALQQARQEGSPFVVPGKTPKIYTRKTTPTNIPYRCERHHRTLIAWLRKKGITDSKPCHLLRKEFGSYVARSFGLFAAQRLLGHSSPNVTEAFYAGLTNLPELNHVKISASKPVQPVVVQESERTVVSCPKSESASLTVALTSSFQQPA